VASYANGFLKERILEALRRHPEGLTIQDISKIIGTHRHTATRYLAELKGAEIVLCRPVGAATLHYLRSGYHPGTLKPAGRQAKSEKHPFEAAL